MNFSLPLYFRYIGKHFLKTIAIVLSTLFTITFLVELAFHFPFKSNEIMILHLIATLFKRLDLLLPLSFLLGTTTVFCSMQKHNEITALSSSGISHARIVAPLFVISIFASTLLYVNHQFILPKTTPWLLEERTMKKNNTNGNDYVVRFLSDGSRIIYTISEMQLKDLYWIKSHNEIWHCEHITFEEELPIGMYVDKLQKDEKHQFNKTASFHKYALPNTFLKAKPKVEKNSELSIGTLINLVTQHSLSITSDKGFVYSQLCYKMINPWFPTMVITAIIPYLLPYQRRHKNTNLYMIGTLSYFLFHTLVKGCIVLAEHYVVSPLFTIILLPLLLQSVLSFRLWKSICMKPNLQTKAASKKASLQYS